MDRVSPFKTVNWGSRRRATHSSSRRHEGEGTSGADHDVHVDDIGSKLSKALGTRVVESSVVENEVVNSFRKRYSDAQDLRSLDAFMQESSVFKCINATHSDECSSTGTRNNDGSSKREKLILDALKSIQNRCTRSLGVARKQIRGRVSNDEVDPIDRLLIKTQLLKILIDRADKVFGLVNAKDTIVKPGKVTSHTPINTASVETEREKIACSSTSYDTKPVNVLVHDDSDTKKAEDFRASRQTTIRRADLMQKAEDRVASGKNDSESNCPVCFRSVPRKSIDVHLERCLSRKKRSRTVLESPNRSDNFRKASRKFPDAEYGSESESGFGSKGDDFYDSGERGEISYSSFSGVEDDWNDKDYEKRAMESVKSDHKFGKNYEDAIKQHGLSETDALEEAASKEESEVEHNSTSLSYDSDSRSECGDISVLTSTCDSIKSENSTSFHSDCNDYCNVDLGKGLMISRRVWYKLFEYQKKCIEWLWKLHQEGTGGILGDEMGLGKTVQIASYLAACKDSGLLQPSIIACPSTTLSQWVKELRFWAPRLRVLVLHASGLAMTSGMLRRKLVSKVADKGGDVILTTYEGLRGNQSLLLNRRWGYLVLDEGHKIRNPEAKITIICKRFQTVHRIVLSGTPIQNNLRELWSLFDFVSPGRLGTLPMFENHFAVPISAGGFMRASLLQVRMAFECAKVLKETIEPFLLRRTKAAVAPQLPKKTEHVLFCDLSQPQIDAYKEFLKRPEVEQLLRRAEQSGLPSQTSAFKCIRALQHICNHPDIYLMRNQDALDCNGGSIVDELTHYKTKGTCLKTASSIDTFILRSGKMLVLRFILDEWFQQGHKVLLFTQGRIMLDLLARFSNALGFKYFRMDGTTPIRNRSFLIERFNDENCDVFLFLLTTKVGGLGINLTGANRVIIYDPDWNPSTDLQARERVWRFGQKRPVTIYRLITSGTIEEKIYHRQIFKQYLTHKILSDPRQRRFLKYSGFRELFTLEIIGQGRDRGDSEKYTATQYLKQTKPKSALRRLEKKRKDALLSKKYDYHEDMRHAEATAVNFLKEDNTRASDYSKPSAHTESSDIFEDAALDTRKKDNADLMDGREKNILQRLFDETESSTTGGGLRQAFQHDVVEQSAQSEPDWRLVQLEAARVAQKAANALQADQSATLHQRDASNIHIPTWTGTHTEDMQTRFIGSASSDILAQLRNSSVFASGGSPSTWTSQNEAQLSHAPSTESGASNNDPIMRFAFSLRNFLASSSEGRSSEEILHRLGGTQTEPEVFREILHQIASHRKGKWKLKPKYSSS